MVDQLPDLEGGAGRRVETTPVLIVNPDGSRANAITVFGE
ncbi:hypothetical protein EV664_107182 [Stakelama pacifica]|uniref:Uncharacterized protein n=1 Tax=Stakelama pacifica TaxID=517720 RepID=A0A4R6FLH2_9SPHN|nr:hypothetical protein EV664_107182 [Stakelama pacifica]